MAQIFVSRDLRGWFQLENEVLLGCGVTVGREIFMGRTGGEGPHFVVTRA